MISPIPRLCTPSLSIQSATAIASDLYGIEGEMKEFRGEREQIFQVLQERSPRFMLRVADNRENLDGIEFQNRVLKHIEEKGLDINTPRVCASRQGKEIEFVETNSVRYSVRLFTYVPGTSIESAGSSQTLLSRVGAALARLDLALIDAGAWSTPYPLIWRMEDSPQLARYADVIADGDQRSKVVSILDEFENESLPLFGRLRSHVIHNDFNPRNVLVDHVGKDRICGVIDFSDSTKSALVVDLAVAVARHASFPDPIQSMVTIVEGYDELLPLTDMERHVLFNLVCVRLAMVILVWSWRLTTYDLAEAASAVESAFRLLDHLSNVRASRVSNRGIPRAFRS